MTITTNDTRDEYTATSGQTLFNYTFKIFESTDLNVYVTPVGQDPDDDTDIVTGYSVTGLGDEDGGTITLVTPTTAGDSVTIVSDIPESRTTNYQNNGDFLPDTVNDDFDRVVSLAKQTSDRANRTLAFQESEQNASGLSIATPEALKFLRWKSDLSGLENVDSTVTNSVIVLALSEYDSLATAVGSIGSTIAELWIDQDDSSTAIVPDNITLRFLPGNVLSGTVTISSPENVLAHYRQVVFSGTNITFSIAGTVSPVWFGATGDGVTLDTVAFQSAIDSLPAGLDYGGEVFIPVPDEDYLIDTVYVGNWSVDGSNNVLGVTGARWSLTFRGQSTSTTQGAPSIKFGGSDQPGTTSTTFNDTVGPYDIVTDDLPIFKVVGSRHIKFENLLFDGDDLAFSGIHFDQSCPHCELHRVIINNCRVAVRQGTRYDWGGSIGSPYYGYGGSPYYIANVIDYPANGGYQTEGLLLDGVKSLGCRVGYSQESQQAINVLLSRIFFNVYGQQTGGISNNYEVFIYGGNTTINDSNFVTDKDAVGLSESDARIKHYLGSCRLNINQMHTEGDCDTFFEGLTTATDSFSGPRLKMSVADIGSEDILIRGGGGVLTLDTVSLIGEINRTWKTADTNQCYISARNCQIDHITNTGDSTSNAPSFFLDLFNIDRIAAVDAFISGEWAGDVKQVNPKDGLSGYSSTRHSSYLLGDADYRKEDGISYAVNGVEHFKDYRSGIVDEVLTTICSFDASTSNRNHSIFIDVSVQAGLSSTSKFVKCEQLMLVIAVDSAGNISKDIQQSTDSAEALDGYASISTAWVFTINGTDVELQLSQNNENLDTSASVYMSGRILSVTPSGMALSNIYQTLN